MAFIWPHAVGPSTFLFRLRASLSTRVPIDSGKKSKVAGGVAVLFDLLDESSLCGKVTCRFSGFFHTREARVWIPDMQQPLNP